MAAKDFIVAIELGSSKMTGIAGRKNADGSISVLAVVKEDSTSFIRKGVISNIDKTVQSISNVVMKLSNILKSEISKVYVGVGGQSIRSIKNNIINTLPEETIITQDMVTYMMDSNRDMQYQDKEILDAATQEYKVGNQLVLDPVGMQSSSVEGNFLNIVWRKKFYNNLNNCFASAHVAIAEMFLAPLALAEAVLTNTERRSGCALVDIGADTTTVSVFYKNILRHLAVIPLGSNNVTKDIASLQIEESDAEQMKLKYASAYTENDSIDDNKTLSIDNERSIPQRQFVEIVEGRMQEIIENVWYQIPPEYAGKLLAGIVITGGGANMKNIDVAFRNHTHQEKIRVAKFVTQTITSTCPDITAQNAMMNTILGLLAKGDINCAGHEKKEIEDLFGNNDKDPNETAAEGLRKGPRQVTEIGTGVVMTQAEKLALEEKKRKEAEEKARILAEQEAEEKAQKERERQKLGNKMKRMFGGLIDKLKQPEEE